MKKYRVDIVVKEAYFVTGEDALGAERAALEMMWERRDMLIKVSKFKPGDSEYGGEFEQ